MKTVPNSRLLFERSISLVFQHTTHSWIFSCLSGYSLSVFLASSSSFPPSPLYSHGRVLNLFLLISDHNKCCDFPIPPIPQDLMYHSLLTLSLSSSCIYSSVCWNVLLGCIRCLKLNVCKSELFPSLLQLIPPPVLPVLANSSSILPNYPSQTPLFVLPPVSNLYPYHISGI